MEKRPSFDQFVFYLEKFDFWDNSHWVPQVSMIPVPVSRLKYIGRVENLDRDLEHVVKELFGDGIYRGTIARSSRRQGSRNLVADYYSEKLRKSVYNLYINDFQSLGYDSEF
ncbi:sulfotransferase family 2 domain-containing protein [Alkalispirochaeta alkalica]|uniref:sulfotransferase family 2 domain-containing protein n=1 Tax=Alkalispirochaeta alkalica TaxID=46356 RepID=UPI0003A2ECDF|nr:sulfotransferase family 2 domain-containing protein [Alkalispirochaeta alkalica]